MITFCLNKALNIRSLQRLQMFFTMVAYQSGFVCIILSLTSVQTSEVFRNFGCRCCTLIDHSPLTIHDNIRLMMAAIALSNKLNTIMVAIGK